MAKQNGVYKGRKPIQRPEFAAVVSLWRKGEITAVEAMKRLDMKSSTFYRKVKEYTNCHMEISEVLQKTIEQYKEK